MVVFLCSSVRLGASGFIALPNEWPLHRGFAQCDGLIRISYFVVSRSSFGLESSVTEKFPILLLGGYGNFGLKIAKQLCRNKAITLIIAGRDLSKAKYAADALKDIGQQTINYIAVDSSSPELSEILRRCGARLVINCAGPFQNQNYHVAIACINAGINYIDLADGRDFVCGFSALNEQAKQAGVIAVSGASTVPALSTAVIDTFYSQFSSLEEIDCGISPGNKTERGSATISAILSYTGKPFETWRDSKSIKTYGWQNLRWHRFQKPMGLRWISDCDIPDLSLYRLRYPRLKSHRFGAGLELDLLHWCMWLMSWFSRIGLIDNWAKYTSPIKRLSHWFDCLGSNVGGMYLSMSGLDQRDKRLKITWELLAEAGDGPYIPTLAAVILAKRMAEGRMHGTGAIPCMGLISLSEFYMEFKSLAIRYSIHTKSYEP